MQDLYVTISTFRPAPSHLSKVRLSLDLLIFGTITKSYIQLLQDVQIPFSRTIGPGEKASAVSLLDDKERIRGIKIYENKPVPTPPHDYSAIGSGTTSALTHTSVHRYKYYAGFLPTSLPNQGTPFIYWANVYLKSASHAIEMLQATKETVEKVRENEPGTLCYLWLQDIDDAKHICVFEMYRSRDDLKVHEGTEWYSEYGSKIFPLAESHEFMGAEWEGGMFEGL